MFSDSKI